MAESLPPAAKVEMSGRRARRRHARKGKVRPAAADSPDARGAGGRAHPTSVTPRENDTGPRPAHAPPAQTAEGLAKRPATGPAASSAVATGSFSAPGGPAPLAKPAFTSRGEGAPTFSRPPLYRQSYAAIDLGTNNCRLLIARPSGEHFTVIDAFSRVVRLGEGLAQTGRLSDEAMDRTLGALRVCAEKLMRRNVFLARSVATEACRRAENGSAFIERVREETGIALDIISAREEARLAVLGCHVLLEQGLGPAMIFDIGGGSTELVLIESTDTVPRILDWQSVPWGVVSLSESCGDEGTTREARVERYRHMHGLVAESFAAFARRTQPARESASEGGPLRLLGTSGTVTTLASLHLELPQYDRSAVDGLIVPSQAMRAISERLSTMAIEERRELPCIGRERADLVVAGCAILEAILDLWPASRLGVADRGIREGILRSLISGHGSAQNAGRPATENRL
ncbi:Ppx/GppA family phosphatase [uncultured Novosphingobium sp.]|uniref:Ppx/GppA phosphatase family protein n=1 Tax=uncultured Novosphingobium sp. TaxID=292277 RepID=UPI00258E75FE|nr:Ppx/GppA family phosphatase [uncultured Novosphingobium sp.]